MQFEISRAEVLHIGPIEMQVFGIHFLLLFDGIMLNLPIVYLFIQSNPQLHNTKKRMWFLKMHYMDNLNVTEKV